MSATFLALLSPMEIEAMKNSPQLCAELEKTMQSASDEIETMKEATRLAKAQLKLFRAEVKKAKQLSASAKCLNAASFKITKRKKRSDLFRRLRSDLPTRFPPKKGLCESFPSKKGLCNEDGTEVEYRKPGSRVLYLGDVCEITVSHLSDLVGSDGLVYVVGFSDVVNMVDTRPNVITIFEKPYLHSKYRMIVSMVDVIFVDAAYPHPVEWIVNNATFYLKAGGRYMISTQANNIDLTGQGKDLFANHRRWREFNPIELVMLEPIMREYVMAVGGFRVLEE